MKKKKKKKDTHRGEELLSYQSSWLKALPSNSRIDKIVPRKFNRRRRRSYEEIMRRCP